MSWNKSYVVCFEIWLRLCQVFYYSVGYLLSDYPCACSGNPKDEPGAVVCRVAQSFLRFGSFQLHASRGKEDLDIVRTLADYTIRHHFPLIENMSKSESLSFSTGKEDNAVVDLTSNKYAGNYFDLEWLHHNCYLCKFNDIIYLSRGY